MSSEVVVQKPEERALSIYEVFGQMARDPSIDPARIAALMELQIKAEERNAEKEFNAAFARLQPRMPRITKHGTIDMGSKGQMKFARYEDLDAAIKPLYTAEGFALSFISHGSDKGIALMAVLRHAGGHSMTSEMQLPADTGAGRNALQALGSSLSYARRYLTCELFNIVTVGQDDDGQSLSAISAGQVETLEDLMHEMSFTPEARSKFLETFGVKAISDLQRGAFIGAKNLLEAKRRNLGSKEK